MKGTVYKSTGKLYEIKAQDGQFYSCRIRGKLRLEGSKSTNPIAVGDQVEFEPAKNTEIDDKGAITKIYPRTNYVVRKSVNLSKQSHVLAANIDRVFFLFTLSAPETTTLFADRFLASAEAFGLEVVLLFHKKDLYDAETAEQAAYIQQTYQEIGYKCRQTSVNNADDLEWLHQQIAEKTSVFFGHSGAGKSTLINALSPGLSLKTKSISKSHGQGQHTTTHAQMYDLTDDARLIDTPGVRGFGIVHIEPDELRLYFKEIFKASADCKFHNCLHKNEPNCAVIAAVESGDIEVFRYENYLRIIEPDDEHYRKEYYSNS
ncbi:MAG: ribosome small subunit-dependent GTPase A [Flavobacteriaceae bacterium]|nr:ribosome small subunit-dependent GTPase A [Flavobacteriaceae bacterium]